MENQDFTITIKTVWILVIGNFLLSIFSLLAKIQDWEFSQILITIGFMLLFSTWIIIFNDMVKNKIYNKKFWIMTLFIMPHISSVFYLFQRNKLLRLGNKLHLATLIQD